MKTRQSAVIYGAIVLVAIVIGLILMISADIKSARDPIPTAVSQTRAPISSNNNIVSNANAINRQPVRPSTSRPVPPTYPTLAPPKPLSQTIEGYTVTLYPMFANANLVVLTYTVQSSFEDFSKVSPFERLHGDETYTVREIPDPQLTSTGGHVLPWFRDLGWQFPRKTATSMLVFRTHHPAPNMPRELQLHLTLSRAEIPIFDEQGAGYHHSVIGPFEFDFSLPVDTVTRIAEVNQTVTTPEGDTITIVRLIVTRHDVRVVWRLDKSGRSASSPSAGVFPYGLYACCTLKLEVGGYSADFWTDYSGGPGAARDREQVLLGSLLAEQGQWTISAWYFSTHTGSMYYPPRPGPVFRFSVPPAINSLQP